MRIIIRSFTRPDIDIEFDEALYMKSLYQELSRVFGRKLEYCNVTFSVRETMKWFRLRQSEMNDCKISEFIDNKFKCELERNSTLYVLVHEPREVFWLGAQFNVRKSYKERLSKTNMSDKLPEYFKYFDISDLTACHIIDLFLLEKFIRHVEKQLKDKSFITNRRDAKKYIDKCKECERNISKMEYVAGEEDKVFHKQDDSYDECIITTSEYELDPPVIITDLSMTIREAKLLILNCIKSMMCEQYDRSGYIDLAYIFKIVKQQFDLDYSEGFYNAETVVKKNIAHNEAPVVMKKLLNNIPSPDESLFKKSGFFAKRNGETVTEIFNKLNRT